MSLYAINNFFHLLATVTWIGGMVYMNLILFPAQSAIAPSERGKLMGTLAKRFSIAAWISVIVLLITGLVKTPSEFLINTSTHFGLWLTVKHIAILLMIIFGLIISIVLAPKMKSLAPKPGEQPSAQFIKTQGTLGKLSITNLVLGILVLLCVSMMKF
jgi:copper resistance protein D